MIKDKISTINYCAIVHLVLFLVVAHLMMGRELMLQIMEYLIDAFEIVFSPLLLSNSNVLIDVTTKEVGMKVLLIFIVTAIPAYVIGYPLFSRFYKIDS